MDTLLKIALFPLWIMNTLAERGNKWCQDALEWSELPDPRNEN